MLNAVKILVLLSVLVLCSCGKSSSEIYEQDSIAALAILEKANIAFDACQYEKSMQLLDSIDSVYIAQIGVRRDAMKLRPMVKEKLIIKEIQRCDSLLAEYQLKNASREEIFKVNVNKMKLERQLQVARNQMVRLNDE